MMQTLTQRLPRKDFLVDAARYLVAAGAEWLIQGGRRAPLQRSDLRARHGARSIASHSLCEKFQFGVGGVGPTVGSVEYSDFSPTIDACRSMLKLRMSDHDSEHAVGLIATSASHVATAYVGRRMYQLGRDPLQPVDLRVLAAEHTTIEFAATNLVARSTATAIDLCSAAAGRILGLAGPSKRDVNREHDKAAFIQRFPAAPSHQATQ